MVATPVTPEGMRGDLGGVKRALETNSNVRVMHPTPKGDHVWGLDQTAKTKLRKAIAEGLFH